MLDSLPISKGEFDEIAIDIDLSDCNGSPELVAAFTRKAVAVSCTEDALLFRIGEPGASVYLVRSGEVGLLLPIAPKRAASAFEPKPGLWWDFRRHSATNLTR